MQTLKNKTDRAREIGAELRTLAQQLESGGDADAIEARANELQAELSVIERSVELNQRAAEIDRMSMSQIGTAQLTEDRGGLTLESENLAVSDTQMRAISEPQYRHSFTEYLRRGESASSASIRSLQVGLDDKGGYLVPPEFIPELVQRAPAPATLVSYVQQITASSDRVHIPRSAYTGQTGDSAGDIYTSAIRMEWTAETQAAASQTADFGLHEIPIYEGQVEVPVSRQLREDSAFDLMSYLADQVTTAVNMETERVILNGDGAGKPKGVLRDVGGANEPPGINVGNPPTPQGLMNLVYGLPQQYAANAVAVMNRTSTFATLAGITQNSNLVWDGVFATAVSAQRTETLLGNPIVFSPFAPASGGGANIVAFGDWFQAYLLVRRLGISIQVQDLPRDKFVYFVARTRFGGDVRNPRALRIGVQS